MINLNTPIITLVSTQGVHRDGGLGRKQSFHEKARSDVSRRHGRRRARRAVELALDPRPCALIEY